MKFKDIKDLCYEHDELRRKTKIIAECEAIRNYFKVTTHQIRGDFYLGDEEIKVLNDYYEKRGSEIERIIYNLNKKI